MAIYNGTQKIDVSGVDKVYVGTQLVYQKSQPLPDLYYNYYDGVAANTVSVKLNPTTKQFEPFNFTYPSGSEQGICGSSVWADGTNIYYSQNRSKQYILNGDTWSDKTWNDTYIQAENIGIFYANNSICHINSKIKALLSNGNWSSGTTPSVYSSMTGANFFYDCIQKRWWFIDGNSYDYYYDTSWHSATNPISGSYGRYYWSIPGRNEMFYSNGTNQKHKTRSSWSDVTWTGLPSNISTWNIFYYNNNTYYIAGSTGSYVLYKLTSNYGWEQSNDFSLDYFNNNNKSINIAQFWTGDTVKPSCKINSICSTYKRLEE